MTRIADHAQRMDAAARHAQAVEQFGADELTIQDAYAVQRESVGLRLARGETVCGLKMGFTSRAKMIQMGVSDMICGHLTDAMMVEDGGIIALSKFVHPRVEPEIAFLLRKPITGAITPLQALDAVEAVAPALEIIDSRYQNFRFSLTDVVADNSSSSAFVVGPWARKDTDLSNLGMIMNFDGRPEAFSSTAALLGHPLRSLAAAARLSARWDVPLKEGAIVLAGGATAASSLRSGVAVSLEIEKIGAVGFQVEGTQCQS